MPSSKSSGGAAAVPVIITGVTIPTKAKNMLKEALQNAGLTKAKVTDGPRTERDQAKIMYSNTRKTNVASQKALYGNVGDKVIDVYDPKKSEMENVDAMEKKIKELGASNVSKHCSSTVTAFDVAFSSITDKKKFEDALINLEKNHKILKYIAEKNNKCFHIEVKK